ncbi:hypothetical protein [Mycoplasmoides pirum]|uniref:hypothetical protein n=1 Tax=Mycoplasmoides pirum TaxID=2122 RepID=UPI00047FF28D|nr:hypothetical protein [Mycoplasmoides pirum]
MAKKIKIRTNDKITLVGLLCSFIFGLLIGGIVYIVIKALNLKNILWVIVFMFLPPVIGAIIFFLSRAKMVKVKTPE